jgi:hypothetical protein
MLMSSLRSQSTYETVYIYPNLSMEEEDQPPLTKVLCGDHTIFLDAKTIEALKKFLAEQDETLEGSKPILILAPSETPPS